MDWKYLNSLDIENLSEEKKDELYSTIAWFDCDSEKINLHNFKVLFKVSQEVIKYKGEQVETLLAELDEIAAKQAEDEIKKGSDPEIKSLRSKKSIISLDHEDLEEKIQELKTKLKLQNKLNNKHNKEIVRYKEKVTSLEQDKIYLQNELRNVQHDDSLSDISEAVKEQHKDLIETVHEKNKQISQLLDEVEAIENDNSALREKVTALRDELSHATKEISNLNNELTASRLLINEKTELISQINGNILTLKDEIEELHQEKENRNKEIQRFSNEIDIRVDEWKKILEQKNLEIKELKTNKTQSLSSSSSVGDHGDFDYSQIKALNVALKDHQEKIYELQDQLLNATKEMEESTKLIEKLTIDRNLNVLKSNEQQLMLKELQGQLKTSNNRSHELEESIEFIQKKYESKDKDLKDLINVTKQGGNVELSNYVQTIQDMKSQIHMQERQISNLVKSCNKLQDAVEQLDLENAALRSQLGLSDDDSIIVNGVRTKRKNDKKTLQKLQKKIQNLQEEKLNLRLEVQNLSKTTFNNVTRQQKQDEELGKPDIFDYDHEKYREVVEENEALRKGLHEVLDSVHETSGDHNIQATSLEKLLKALDVKHIAGWYHPAMRLQAELHALQGTNAEVRSELQTTREELNLYKKNNLKGINPQMQSFGLLEMPKLPEVLSSSNAEIISNLNIHLMNVLNNYNVEESANKSLTKQLELYKQEFSTIQGQTKLLYKQYIEEKESWSIKKNNFDDLHRKSEEKIEVLTAQIKEVTEVLDLSKDERATLQKILELSENTVILKRKCLYLENSQQTLLSEVSKLRDNIINSEKVVGNQLIKYKEENKHLISKIVILENTLKGAVDSHTAVNMQNYLDSLIVEQRNLLQKFADLNEKHTIEIKEIEECKNTLSKENEELRVNLTDALTKLHVVEVSTCNLDDTTATLTKKLAEIEVNEITERQRANHTNNLYELVKEQLRNSEERYTEFEAFSKELMHKNLALQETIKKLEDKIQFCADVDIFKEMKEEHLRILKENENIVKENTTLSENIKILDEIISKQKLWSSFQEFEFLNLRHQIVDLQSSTDDKAVIARLSSDVVHARLSEAECHKLLEKNKIELNELQIQNENTTKQIAIEKMKCSNVSRYFEEKIRGLQQIILHHRVNFYGFIPYTSESKFIEKLHQISNDRHSAFLSLQMAQMQEKEVGMLKEQVSKQLNLVHELQSTLEGPDYKEVFNQWLREKNVLQLQELKYRRQCEFKESQLQQTVNRISCQEEQIARLEEELLKSFHMVDSLNSLNSKEPNMQNSSKVDKSTGMSKPLDAAVSIRSSKSTQTLQLLDFSQENSGNIAILENMQTEVKQLQEEVNIKAKLIQEFKSKITELEMNISLFRNQLGDKQSQITFYEKYILDLQSKKEQSELVVIDNVDAIATDHNMQETLSLKSKVNDLQTTLATKEESIVEYQSLLKKDRDEHSLAAARMQEEVKRLQKMLSQQQQTYNKLKENKSENLPNKTVMEKYFKQVHELEKHSTDIHVAMKNINEQLLETKDEVNKWKHLAESRLESLNKIQNDFKLECENNNFKYKQECDKWKTEVSNLKAMIQQYRKETDGLKSVTEMVREKDLKIHELSTSLRQAKAELKRKLECNSTDSTRLSELESENEQLMKEFDASRKRFDQIMKKEKSAREEIRNLKGQLIKRPLASARSDRSDNTAKEQYLQKKILNQENEIKELKDQLEKQLTINEAHRLKVAEDFDKWNKMKHFQQMAEKYKNKLKVKEGEFDKLQHTSHGYRILIERLEREKHSLENRLKILRTNCTSMNVARFEMLELENTKFQTEIETLKSKLEMQHHHSGGLGAVMLQEKLEAQERKIAILELSAKGTSEIRAEMERLQATITSLQKLNLRLEAENLELSLDMQKVGNDTPHLREQIHHLENYIEVLKEENSTKQSQTSKDFVPQSIENKKAGELERTVFVLKRLVEKLQAENKRLQSGGKGCVISARTASEEKLRNDLKQVKELYGESMQKVTRLEQELTMAIEKMKSVENKPLSYSYTALQEELSDIKSQLSQKTQLLDKVKVLLQRAAAKEKNLLEEVATLRLQISRV